MEPLLQIIFEDTALLVVNKPAGLVCHPTKGDERSSLVGRLRLYLGKSGHLINRLDRETSGVVLVALDSEMAGELGKIWASRIAEKTYLAIVHGHLPQPTGLIEAPLGHDEASEVAIKDCVRADGASATTRYRALKQFEREEGRFTLLEVQPLTGRKHQIRIHLAHIGHPIVGDKMYGGDETLYLDFVFNRLTDEQKRRLILPHQALHAARLRLPIGGEEREFHAEPEPWFKSFVGIV